MTTAAAGWTSVQEQLPLNDPERAAVSATKPVFGNAADGIAGLLHSLGISESRTRDSVEHTAVDALRQRGLTASVVSLRWGKLLLQADPQTARLVQFETDALLDEIAQRHPGTVTSIRVQAAR